MPDPSIFLSDPLVKNAACRNDRYRWKALVLWSAVVGLCSAVILNSLQSKRSNAVVQNSALALAWHYTQSQSARAQHGILLQPARLSGFMAPKSFWRSTQTARSQVQTVQEQRADGADTVQEIREDGVVLRCNYDKGYGFIQPKSDGREDLFFHVGSLDGGDGTVERGDYVTFIKALDPRTNKEQAMKVQVTPGFALEKETGVILRCYYDKGYGFIHPDAKNKSEIFFHVNKLVGGDGTVEKGDGVTYIREFDARSGKDHAVDVYVTPGGRGDVGKGVVVRWNNGSQFGYIRPNGVSDKSQDLFVHKNDFVNFSRDLRRGAQVSYVKDFNSRDKRFQAIRVERYPFLRHRKRSEAMRKAKQKEEEEKKTLIERVKQFQKTSDSQNKAWYAFCDTQDGRYDPAAYEPAVLQTFLEEEEKKALINKVKQFQKTSDSQNKAWYAFCDTQDVGRYDPAAYEAAVLQTFLDGAKENNEADR